MRTFSWILATSIAVVWSGNLAWGQCRGGGGRGGSASGAVSPLGSVAGLTSPLGQVSPISTSPAANYQALQYQYQLAQQRYQMLEQQRYLEMLAAQQAQMMAEIRENQADDSDEVEGNREQRSERTSSREAMLRRNALKLFQTAERANLNNRPTTAIKYYRKVVKLLDEDDPLAENSRQAITKLRAGEIAEN